MDGDGGAQWVKWGEIIRKEEVIRLWARFIQPARLQVIAYADFTVKAPASGLSFLLSLLLFLLMESIRTWLVGEIGLKSEVSDPPLCSRLESDTSAVATSEQSSPPSSSSLMLSSSLFLFQSPLSLLSSTVQVSSGLLSSCSPNITSPPWIPPWVMHISLNKSPF